MCAPVSFVGSSGGSVVASVGIRSRFDDVDRFFRLLWLPALLFFYAWLAAQFGAFLGDPSVASLLLSIAMVLYLSKLGVYLTVITVL